MSSWIDVPNERVGEFKLTRLIAYYDIFLETELEESVSVLYFTFLLIPDSKHSEYEGAEGGSEEAPPVVPHSKKCWRDLNTEQHPCNAQTYIQRVSRSQSPTAVKKAANSQLYFNIRYSSKELFSGFHLIII